jgi:hypothetical protein
MRKHQIRLEVIRREPIDRQRLIRALVETVRARKRLSAESQAEGQDKMERSA